MGLVMAGSLFDTLQQDAPGAIGPALKEVFGISNAELVTVNTVTVIGGLIGRLVGGYLADKKGRRFALSSTCSSTPWADCSARSPPTTRCSWQPVDRRHRPGWGVHHRAGHDLGDGRHPPPRHRVSASWASPRAAIGNFLAYGLFVVLLGPLDIAALGGDLYSWRWMFAFLAIPAVLVVIYRRYLPESPRFLVSQGRIAEANRALTILDIRRHPPPPDTAKRSRRSYTTPTRRLRSRPRSNPSRNLQEASCYNRTVAIGAASWMAFGAQVTLLALLPTLLVSKRLPISTSLVFTMIMYAGTACSAPWPPRVAARFRVGSHGGDRTDGSSMLPLSHLNFALFAERGGVDPAVRLDLPVLLACSE